ncbi:MAG TPA: PAS domain S-box protein [Planctomycetaceae bacterium]|nr:PAS domain S-box protein [Planctomycetaceae bacterium]
MRIVLRALPFLSALALVVGVSVPARADGRRLVVLLYPQGSNAAVGNRLMEQGIRSVFENSSADTIDVYNEYLELSAPAKSGLLQLQAEFLRRKYSGRKVDLVVAWLSPSLDFALEHRQEIFPGVPIVYSTVEERELKARKLPPDVIGAPINLDMTGTLDVALRLHPQTQHVFVVAGTAKFDEYWVAEARKAFRPYEQERDFVYLTGLTMEDLLNKVAHLPERSIAYYLYVFRDGSGKDLVPADVVERLAKVSNAPIYGYGESYIGRGLVGGHVVSLENEAKTAGALALRILAGETPQQIGPQPASETVYIFDARQLARWGIPEARLPAGSVVRFKELSLWGLYKWPIIGVISLCGLEALLIATLLVLLANRKRANIALRESEERFRLMADTAPVMIWMSGTDKACTYFNKPWLDFTGRALPLSLGDGWAADVHPEDLKSCLEAYSQAFDDRESFRMQYRLRRHDGEYRWIVDIGVPRIDSDGKFEGYIGSCIDITDQKRVEETMRDNQRELRMLSGRLIQAQEMERRRIARELHDDLSQSLALLSVKIDMLRQKSTAASGQSNGSIDELSTHVKQLSTSVHNISHQLHPLKLEQLGLVAAIRALCWELSRSHGVSIDFAHGVAPQPISDEAASCLYRIVQESARNVIKHSGARRAKVELEASIEAICLRIADDGTGFDPRLVVGTGGLGLVSMRERLQLVGGTLTIDSRPSGGTRIDARIPLTAARTEATRPPTISDGTLQAVQSRL